MTEQLTRPDEESRDTAALLRALLDDTQLLLRKHVELAKHEVLEAVDARLKAAAAGAVAGVFALFGLGFLAAAGAWGLATVMPDWLARIVVGGAFLVVAAGAGLLARRKLVEPPMSPEVTVATLKEDVGWARAQLRRSGR